MTATELRSETRLASLEDKLLPYQADHVRTLVAALLKHGAAIDASDTGTGKTYSAIAAMLIAGLRIFVVTPKAVIPGWLKAAEHFGEELVDVVNYEKLRTGKTEWGVWENQTRKQGFTWLLEEGVGIVFDEVHRCKDYSTQNCRMAVEAIEAGIPCLGLSATAADNPMQMKFVALATNLIKRPQDFFGWMLEHGVRKSNFGMHFCMKFARRPGAYKKEWIYDKPCGDRILNRLHGQIFPEHGSRMRIADLGDQFPTTKIIAEAYMMDNAAKIAAVYAEMAREIARLNARSAHDRGKNDIRVIQLRARQQTELLKVPTLCSMAKDAVSEGESVVIIVNFEETLVALATRLGTAMVIHGDQNAKRREEIRAAFDDDSEPVLVMNIRAGGVGIGIQGKPDGRPRLSLISPTFSGQDLKQAFGRPWRAGGAPSVQKVIFAAGTVEESACQKVKDKIERIDTLNDGDLDAALSF